MVDRLSTLVAVAVVTACATVPMTPPVPLPGNDPTLQVLTARDGVQVVYAQLLPETPPRAWLLYVSGVTGFNHRLMQQQSDAFTAAGVGVLYVYPRGTGYSGGERGDLPDVDVFVDDHRRALAQARSGSLQAPVFVMGASMGAALAVKVALGVGANGGVILVNPAFRLRELKGASPTAAQYLRYAMYYVFRRHTPVVDMGGDPELIAEPRDREEARQRKEDPLVQPLHSMHTMMLARDVMEALPANASRCNAPLLLLNGMKDPLVDPSGHDVIVNAWKGPDKRRVDVPDGAHGYSTVVDALPQLSQWVVEHLPRAALDPAQ